MLLLLLSLALLSSRCEGWGRSHDGGVSTFRRTRRNSSGGRQNIAGWLEADTEPSTQATARTNGLSNGAAVAKKSAYE